MSPARWAAYQAVAAVREGTDLATALAGARAPLEDRRDRALAGEIALGVFRWRAALDHAIGHLAKRHPDTIDPPLLDILRVAAYQMLRLERVPAAAAVNDAVDMARRAGRTSAAGFVNGVLRALGRRRDTLPFPPRPEPSRVERADGREQALEYLSVTLSHPRWLAARWLDRYGFDAAEAWARFNNAPAPLTLRANRLRGDRDMLAARLATHGVQTTPTRFAPEGLAVLSGNPLATPIAGDGTFAVQDEASQLVALMAGGRSGERMLDACASPGGKTIALAAAVGADGLGLVVAADFRPKRIDLLADTVRAAAAGRVRLVRLDLRRPLPFRAEFDAVLVDAPCSGLGTIRRDPDIRWRRRDSDLAGLARDELAMLGEASRAVRPGGRLIYATCSSEPEENDDVVSQFLHANPHFAQTDPRDAASLVTRLDAVASTLDATGALRTLPHVHGPGARFQPKEKVPIQELLKDRTGALLVMSLAVLVAPLVEETLFRGYLYPFLAGKFSGLAEMFGSAPAAARKFGVGAGILVTGVFFGILHGMQLGWTWGLVVMLILVGIALTYIRARSGTVVASYLLHLGYNGTIAILTAALTRGFRSFPQGP